MLPSDLQDIHEGLEQMREEILISENENGNKVNEINMLKAEI